MNEPAAEPVRTEPPKTPVFSSPWAALFAHFRESREQQGFSRP